jgi:hypothetical protein
MYKRFFYNYLLVIAGLFLVEVSFSQSSPDSHYNTALPGGINLPVGSDADELCPSLLPGYPSVDTFRVEVNTTDVGNGIWFEWVVYGGTIVYENGISNPSNEASAPQNVSGVPYFYISKDHRYTAFEAPLAGEVSKIAIRWHTTDVPNAWVAVRQHSEWGCTDSSWSVYSNNIFNQKPVITSFPSDITIAFDDRLNFILPQPAANDPDACPSSLTYVYQVTGASSHGPTVSSNPATRTINLGQGVNTIKWTISDGMKDSIDSYIITVDPQPLISHIAWTNPICAGAAEGTLFVTDTLAYSFNPPLQYSLNGGAWSANHYYTGRPAGSDTIRARVVYDVDKNNDGSTEQTIQLSAAYGITLRDPATLSVDRVPPQSEGLPNVDTNDPQCASDSTGSIWVNPASMIPQNRSLSFNGTTDHIRLNKSYNGEISSLSVAAWIKVPAVSLPTAGAIVSFNNARFFQLRVSQSTGGSSSSYVEFQTVTPSGVSEFIQYPRKINDGLWHLVVATFNAGQRRVYIDGVPYHGSNSSAATFGTSSVTAYGMIGARSTATAYGQAPAGDYFRGNMVELGIWNTVIDSAAVVGILKNGIGMAGPNSYWILNDLPANVSTQPAIFSDFGNLNMTANQEWGRVYSYITSPVSIDAPVLYNWNPDKFFPDTELNDIPQGDYELTVLDNFGCPGSGVTQTYTLVNQDNEPPKVLVNMALINNTTQRGRVTQSTTAPGNPAYLAVDGNLDNSSFSGTTVGSEQWWQVDMGGTYLINQVDIYHANAGAPTNFWVLISQFPITSLGDTTRANVYKHHFIGTPGSQQSFKYDNNARYLRIYSVGVNALFLAEVEALSPRPSPFERIVYLGDDDCSYVVDGINGSITPVPYDNCGEITSFHHNQSPPLPSTTSLAGFEFPLGPSTPIIWEVIDDSPDTTLLTINYSVRDTVLPVFTVPFVYPADHDTITWCETQTGFSIPIPNATDNYNCPVGATPNYNFTSLNLRIDGTNVRTFTNSEYDPLSDIDSLAIDKVHLPYNVNHRFVWTLTDYSLNIRRDTFFVFVQNRPFINDIRKANVTCYGANDGLINIYRTTSETGKAVAYYLRNATDTIGPQASPIFSGLTPGNYYAWIEVDGCKSPEYPSFGSIVVTEPELIYPNFSVTPVLCYGDSGTIDVVIGATKQLLHLKGGANSVIRANNYAKLDLTATGTVEAMVYFDTLSAAATNSGAGILNYIGGTGYYGLRMVGGDLSFHVGGVTLTVPAASGFIQERTWHHVAATWDGTATRLFIDGAERANGAGTSNTETGGALYIGCLGTGPEETNLHGFVRFARVWNTALTGAQMDNNIRFEDPIVYVANSLVANFPINVNQGTQLQNTADVTTATVVVANVAWQAYAFYWEGTTPQHIAYTEDLTDAPAQTYYFSVQGPYECTYDTTIVLQMTDTKAPKLIFYDATKSFEILDAKILRNTNQTTNIAWVNPDLINGPGDCTFTPQGSPWGEFDPEIDDWGCPSSQVTLTWTIPATAESGLNTLSLRPFSDTTVVIWSAIDGTMLPTNRTTKTMNYYIRDNERPVLTLNDTIVNANTGNCYYTVPDATTFVPAVADNCPRSSGRLWNNYPGGGFTDNLNGINIPVGSHSIRWIYRDKWGMADTINRTITVVDNQPPAAICQNITVDLNASGVATIDSSRIDNGSNDNCTTLKNIHIIKNIAVSNRTVSASAPDLTVFCNVSENGTEYKAVDGVISPLFSDCSSYLSETRNNPNWYVRLLGAVKKIYGIRVYNGELGSPLTNFNVQVATNPTFAPAVLTYDSLYTGAAVAGSIYFSIPNGVTGNYVRIYLNGINLRLGLAEVEIYGVDVGADASRITFNCDDVSYNEASNSFRAIDVLLRATDQYNLLGTCWAGVTLRDEVDPTVVPRNYVVSPDALGIVNIIGDSLYTSVGDNCGIDTTWCIPSQFNCANAGENAVALHVRDVNGNEIIQMVSVTVLDTIAPIIHVKNNLEFSIGPNGYHAINPQVDIDNGSTDNCGSIALYSVNPDTVWCSQVGATPVNFTYSVTDNNNNTRTQTVSAIVSDTLAPIVSTNNFTLTIPNTNFATVGFDDFDNSSFDNCGGAAGIKYKAISFDNGFTWCEQGEEDLVSPPPSPANIKTSTSSVTGSTAYTGYPITNCNDGNAGNRYITNASTGVREVIYNFAQNYRMTSTDVYWHTLPIGVATNISRSGQASSPVVAVQGNGGNATYPPAKCNDGLFGVWADCYITAAGTNAGGGNTQEFMVTYTFAQPYRMTSSTVYWNWNGAVTTPPGYRIDQPDNPATIQYFNLTTGLWVTINNIGRNGPLTANNLALNVTTDRIRLIFDDDNRRNSVAEFIVNGYPASDDCELPTVATVYYNSTPGSGPSWTSLGNITPITGPGTPNTLDFGDQTTDAIRLTFDNTTNNRRIGIQEWDVYGYPVGASSDCVPFNCDSIWKTYPVVIRYEDNHGNLTDVYKTFDVEPYFTITDIQLKDCAVTGEQYFSWVSATPVNPIYSWTQVTPTPNLFSDPIGTDNPGVVGTNHYTDGGTIAQMRTARAIADGTYIINLNVTDENGCYDDYEYTFDWVSADGGGAISIKPWEACVDDSVAFYSELVSQNTYWTALDYVWSVAPSVTPLAGGSGFDSIYVRFNQGGTPIDVTYQLSGQQTNILDLGFAPGSVNCRPSFPCYVLPATTPYLLSAPVTGTTNFVNPAQRIVIGWYGIVNYNNNWVDCGTNGCAQRIAGTPYLNNFQSGTVRLNGDWARTGYGWFVCEEGVTYRSHIYEVEKPKFVNPVTDVCPCDTVIYYNDTTYTRQEWTVTGGEIIAGGNGVDSFAVVVWSCDEPRVWSVIPDSVASLKLYVENPLGCGADSTFTVVFDKDWNSIPNITCPNDTSAAASIGSCQHTFPNLPVPVVSDDCYIKSLTNSYNGGANARGTYQLGQHTVTWTVRDYVGNSNTCEQLVTVYDAERPQFTSTPINITIDADEFNCDRIFPDNSRELFAYDNCDPIGTSLHYITVLDDNNDGLLYDTIPGMDIRSIEGLSFELGETRVYYTVTDTADTWNSGSGPNSRSTSFSVFVEDNTPPVFDAIPDTTIANGVDSCSVTALIHLPSAGIYCSDNCTGTNNIIIRYIRRSDGINENDPFQVGETIITYEAEDENLNKTQRTRKIIVFDNQPPTLDVFSNDTITACDASGHRLLIPMPHDNCAVDSLIVTISNIPPAGYYYWADTITVEGFDPNGTGLTDVVNTLDDNADYSVTWEAIDGVGLTVTTIDTLRVEQQPSFPVSGITYAPISCGGVSDGVIIFPAVVAENGARVEYSVDWGATWQYLPVNDPPNEFRNLPANTYGVQIRVNSCSSEIDTVRILGPDPYFLNGVITDPYCQEGADGSIDVVLTGGAPGQQLLTGTGARVNSYPEIVGSQSGTLEAWVYLTTANLGAMIISKGTSYSLGINAGGLFALQVGGKTYNSTGTVGAGDLPELERWYHVAASWDVGSDIAEIYVNANNRGFYSGGGVIAPVTDGSSLYIGSGFNGIIREVRFWNIDYTTVLGYVGDPGHYNVAGGESDLGGCWPMTDALSPSQNKKISASAAVVGGTWVSTYPQPVDYNWTRELDPFWTNDSINISGLVADKYTLVFRDIFRCPAAGLKKVFQLEASDETVPEIIPKADMVLFTNNECQHIISSEDAIAFLPEIIDHDVITCSWQESWTVYSYLTESTFSDVSLVGYSLEYGLNRLTVYVTQNGVQNYSTFYITVEDAINPTSRIDMSLPAIYLNNETGNGNVTMAASEFNDGSDDNCTIPGNLRFQISRDGGDNFDDSVTFYCNDINNPVNIVLLAIDEAGNTDESAELTNIDVLDTVRPIFIGEPRYYGNNNCATNDTTGGIGYIKRVDGLLLTEFFDYDDNCRVEFVWHRINHTTHPEFSDPLDPDVWYPGADASEHFYYEGVSEVEFRLFDYSGNESAHSVRLRVLVLPMPEPGTVGGN